MAVTLWENAEPYHPFLNNPKHKKCLLDVRNRTEEDVNSENYSLIAKIRIQKAEKPKEKKHDKEFSKK